jgi:Heliorhodopsin
LAIGIYLVGAASGPGGPPGFVYAIYASIFVFFNVFALNMVIQYRRAGRWRDYLYGERVYMLLSLFAKSALAWQVFAGTLRPV